MSRDDADETPTHRIPATLLTAWVLVAVTSGSQSPGTYQRLESRETSAQLDTHSRPYTPESGTTRTLVHVRFRMYHASVPLIRKGVYP